MSQLKDMRLMARQLIAAVAGGKLAEAHIPGRVGNDWIRDTAYRNRVSCRNERGEFFVRSLPSPTARDAEDLTAQQPKKED